MWRLGAWNIMDLLLLAASSKMETVPMVGKTWQPSHAPHAPEKTDTCHTDKRWKVEGAWGLTMHAQVYQNHWQQWTAVAPSIELRLTSFNLIILKLFPEAKLTFGQSRVSHQQLEMSA